MSTAGKLYDAHYFGTYGGLPYTRDEPHWARFFGEIADRICTEIRPRTVLDAGCAMGFLVEQLRQRGVEGYGLDISEYALEQVPPEIKGYCWQGSVVDPFPGRYDLIVCIEVLEHLQPRDAERALANLCAHSDDVLFSSTAVDYHEATHFNVHPPEYWAELFAHRGFMRDVDFDATVVTPWAARFRRTDEPPARTIGAYERRLWRLEQENQVLRARVIAEGHEVRAKDEQLHALLRSRTFRYTAPARALGPALRRLLP